MPRRRGPEAGQAAREIDRARWRYAVRNSQFIKEVGALTVHYTIGAE